ncbi:dehydrogenase/reductase SDR family member 13a.3 [Neoarius graeffei]|uniref:dehydrogenase/reductase SDR family member 13a.3 n=1 Tax=Neoarius graeffei TaxID=443677 RepID=UPI00298D5116|nr:dehydrogenase/reductase SDR family member 13a.3 [Neoarius graeffei]
MSVVLVMITAAVTVYILLYYTVFRGARCRSTAVLNGKTAVVTGANTGIGKATALELAKRGARVILACRSQEKAEAAAYDIRRESGNTAVLFMHLDLASLKSVRDFSEAFLKTEPKLDLLINNAGMIGAGRTEDGFGMVFGVNHLGHFLLTLLLLDRLKASGPSRIINVSSRLHRLGSVDFNTLNMHKDLVTGQSLWQCFMAYCHSKLCNVLFTRELANRLEGSSVTCYSLHPGLAATELGRHTNFWVRLPVLILSKLFLLTPESRAQTTLHCALQEGLEPLNGRYFSSCTLHEVSELARDDGLAKKLWEVSERMCGL